MPFLTDADERLRAWLGPVAGDAPVRDGPPADDATEPAITAYLLGLASTPNVRGDLHRPAPVIVRMRYLVCADGADAERALELLDTVLAAALDTPVLEGGHRLEVDLHPIEPETWLALAARPRASFVLRVDAQHTFVPDEVPVVREPLRVVGSTIRSLTGRLLGPGDVPLAGAEVSLAATGVAHRTSSDGTFTFPTVPAGAGPVRLAVRTKGRTFTAEVDLDAGTPVVVRCDPLEG